MTVFIAKDHIENQFVGFTLDEMPLYGIERVMAVENSIPSEGERIPFRLYDDDGELCYTGWLNDDDDCANQSAALRYGETCAGCTYIEVQRNGEWKQDIG